jgi:hypothetical protein
MAQPRVFISSTYYDLKYVRSSLELFIESLGFEPVLSEKGGVPYSPSRALDESCYREVQNCDIYVLIIGGRYGSEASGSKGARGHGTDDYESVTKMEYKAAVERDIPVYVLIEKSVYSEYQTFLRNRESSEVKYAHVDNVGVYRFVEEILAQPRNNPVQSFDRYSEIEDWLRLQWAGLFRELMLRMSSQQQIASLAEQVEELAEVNKTLRRYLEEVVAKVSPEASTIISSESARLAEASIDRDLRQNGLIRFLESRGLPFDIIKSNLSKAETARYFLNNLINDCSRKDPEIARILPDLVRVLGNRSTFEDLNHARRLIGCPNFPLSDLTEVRNSDA